jgi:23S rRNA (uracil1939-C5)-methyltransferase
MTAQPGGPSPRTTDQAQDERSGGSAAPIADVPLAGEGGETGRTPAYAADLAVTPHAMAHGGEAVARAGDGRAVFVAGALPGEAVLVRLTDEQPRFARGVLTALPTPPSPDRIQPLCPHFGAWPARGLDAAAWCGGCQWQHMAYAAQLRYKADALRDTLRRIGRLADPVVHETAGMADPWHYRNHVRLRTGPEGLAYTAVDGAHPVPVTLCAIAHPLVWGLTELLDGAWPAGEVWLRAGLGTGDRLIVLEGMAEAVDEVEVSEDVSVVVVGADGRAGVAAGRPFLEERLAGQIFVVPATSFFQVNTTMAEVLVARLRALVPDGLGTLVDLHSGVGTFAVLLADKAQEVYAIEADPAAVSAAVDNAAGLTHLTLVEADAAEGLAELGLVPDAVVVDPPRTGLDRATVGLLAERVRDTIVYVSCEPSTLARDAGQLCAAGWRLAASWPVDMFPHTYHVESVSLFQRAGPAPAGAWS